MGLDIRSRVRSWRSYASRGLCSLARDPHPVVLDAHEDSGPYVNNAEALRRSQEADAKLPDGLYEACLKTGRVPAAGDVKMMYYTKVSSGYRDGERTMAASPLFLCLECKG